MLQKIGILYAKIVQTLKKRITNTISMAGRGRALKTAMIMFYNVINIPNPKDKKIILN